MLRAYCDSSREKFGVARPEDLFDEYLRTIQAASQETLLR